jgi:outer membrane protein assembly factor BamA
MTPASLLLALALAAPADVVRAVRVEAEPAAGLAALAGIPTGAPLDPEAVRAAVERLYATGRFADVRVDLERDPQAGVTVVLRPRPAPLFVVARIEGDAVLSPTTATRVARLRPGDALWPARLERAGRDVALALVRRGHLEALVEATAPDVSGGAAAVFRIRAGPRVRVGRLAVEGAPALPGVALEELARPREGEIYRKERAEAAREKMRARLARAGHWRAAVELRETYDPGRGRMSLVFRVEPGPRTSLQARGASLPPSLLATVRALVRDGGASSDAVEAGGERIESYLRAQGHRDAVVRPAGEVTPSGETIVYDLRPGPRALAARVTLRDADAALLAGLRTRVGRPIEDTALEEDARVLVSRLEALGYFEARVEPDLPDGGGELAVAFLARPGPRARVSAVLVQGPPLPASRDERGPVELPVRPGLPYRLADIARSRDALLRAWRRAGHLEARVSPEVSFSEARDEARVTFVIEPGARSLVDHVVLAGLARTRPVAVEREMVLRPGEPFSFERVLESQRRLSALGIFERVSISELEPGRVRRDVVVSVQEAPRTAWSWGVGYSEQDRLRGSIELTRRNLGGLGRTASLFGRGSFRGSRFQLNLREPWLLGRQLDSFVTAFWEEENRTSFDYSRRGGTLQATRALSPRASLIVRYLLQDTAVYNLEVPLDEIDRQYRTYAVSGPAASLVFDTRDDPLEPRRGLFLGSDLQLSLAALGGASYLRGFFQATHVQRLRADLVFVLSGRLGLAGTFGARQPALLPLPERFVAGGELGPRGFPYDGVGPRLVGGNGDSYATGGNALLLGGAELRYNLSRSLQLASFLDLGNVYAEAGDIRLPALRRSTGLGLRYRTPIGPIRLDWGYVLDRQPDESRSRFHLTIGHAF